MLYGKRKFLFFSYQILGSPTTQVYLSCPTFSPMKVTVLPLFGGDKFPQPDAGTVLPPQSHAPSYWKIT